MSTYVDREQTQAKHFILRGYLQALAYKVLRNWDVVYVDGFCGPWGSETSDFSDTSFKIALDVLQEAQRIVAEQTGTRRRIKCFFSERKKAAYHQMVDAVAPYNRPDQGFEVKTFNGEFEDAIDEIRAFIGTSFPLIFIDPTGWTGYSFAKIAPLFAFSRAEVLINFMHSFASRFPNHPDPTIVASFDPILGGPGWKDRLNPAMNRGLAIEADRKEATIEDLVENQAVLAKARLLEVLSARRSIPFTAVVDLLLQEFMLRETNVKDVCVDLATEGKIENSWGVRPRKPNDGVIILLAG